MGVLLMLLTICGVIAAVLLVIASLLTKKAWLLNFTLAGVAAWLAIYAVILIGVSIFSTERTLAANEAKEFCGFYLDCHMHTAVTGVRKSKTIGNRTANGEFYIVKVKVFSDAKQATLGLLTVDAKVTDASGNIYQRDDRAETQLPKQPEFETPISPAESFEKEIVFDLPADVYGPRLDMREGYGIDHVIEAVLIGDEDSILHKRNYFGIEEQTQTAGTVR